MPINTTYTNLRSNLVKFWDKVISDNEVVVINRRGTEPVALISVAELDSLIETAHLLRSPRNAERLVRAFNRAKKKIIAPAKIEDLSRELGLGK